MELLSRVADIYSLAGFHALWNPEEPVQAHYMVNPKDARVAEVMPQTCNVVAVSLLAKSFRM
jgi:hypothetical protein